MNCVSVLLCVSGGDPYVTPKRDHKFTVDLHCACCKNSPPGRGMEMHQVVRVANTSASTLQKQETQSRE